MPGKIEARRLDKFYTDGDLADRLIGEACGVLSIDRQEVAFVEPSAGAGAFSSRLANCLAFDIAPEAEGIVRADFLSTEPTWGRDAVAIGNPPFGKRARLAVAFVNRCAESCDAVAFVLPNTFRRYNTQNRLDKGLALVLDADLPEEGSFTFDGSPYSLRCVFQVWVRIGRTYWRDDMRDLRMRKRPPISHPDFACWQHNATEESRRYVDEDWEMAFWRQGYKDYSHVFTKAEDYDEVRGIVYDTNLQMFFVRPNSDEARKRILRMDLPALAASNLSTPGFGKGEFVAEYMRLKEQDEGKAERHGND